MGYSLQRQCWSRMCQSIFTRLLLQRQALRLYSTHCNRWLLRRFNSIMLDHKAISLPRWYLAKSYQRTIKRYLLLQIVLHLRNRRFNLQQYLRRTQNTADHIMCSSHGADHQNIHYRTGMSLVALRSMSH